MAFLTRDLARRYQAAGLRPPRDVVVVPSPVIAVIAGGISAGFRHIMRLGAHPLRSRIKGGLAPRAERVGPIERTVRAATRDVLYAQHGSANFGGPYPPHWTEEDKLIWDATSGAVCQAVAGISLAGRGEAGERRPPGLDLLGRRIMAMIDRVTWDGPDNLPAERDFAVDLSEVPALLDRLFGADARIGWRLIRLATRMLAVSEGSGPLSSEQPGLLHADFAIISDLPVHLAGDDQGRPHSADGPCCRWADGSGLYAVHGVSVPAYLFERPETLTVQVIEQQRNAEVRQVMIECYGTERFLRDSGARVLDHDPRFGTLYRKEIPILGDEPLTVVQVINATPEPDGSCKEYFLRVPPDMPTARAAVAWTFGLDAVAYDPVVET